MSNSRRKEPLLYMEEYRVKQDPQDYGLADEVFNMEVFKSKLQIAIVRFVYSVDLNFCVGINMCILKE